MKRLVFLAILACACSEKPAFDPDHPGVGPGAMVGNGAPITDGHFAGGDDPLPGPREVTPPDDTRPPDCNSACLAYCDAAALENPVNRGLCRSLWGVGLSPHSIDHDEACRRLFVDMVGEFPSAAEMQATCTGTWGETVDRLMADPRFVLVNQRHWADEFLYSTTVVNVQSIYDLDELVGKLYRGLVPYDLFAAVASAHPVLVRRRADPRDRAEAAFRIFLGRPPFENERADMARLYGVWQQGYYDHPLLHMRVPDAYLGYPCIGEDGKLDAQKSGECTSVLWGFHDLLMQPDLRAINDPQHGGLITWQGLLRADEWEKVEAPGRILARDVAFWEHAVDRVLQQYLGYDLGAQVPEVRDELVRHLLKYGGDIRSVHHAVATSVAYLQSNAGDAPTRYRWTWGPMKQVDAETWIGSLAARTGSTIAICDHRISDPQSFVESGSLSGYRLIAASRWKFGPDGNLDERGSELARTLGGCPDNLAGSRFQVVSILTTARQLAFAKELCNPTLEPDQPAAPVSALLPEGVGASKAVTPELARDVAKHLYGSLLGHVPDEAELDEAAEAGTECANTRCRAEEFARPFCFALLSSADMLFY